MLLKSCGVPIAGFHAVICTCGVVSSSRVPVVVKVSVRVIVLSVKDQINRWSNDPLKRPRLKHFQRASLDGYDPGQRSSFREPLVFSTRIEDDASGPSLEDVLHERS